MPNYVVLITHQAPDFIRLCQLHYLPDQRCVVNKDREIMFYITAEAINDMLQMSHGPRAVSLSIEDLTQLYLDLDFPSRFMIFQTFWSTHVDIPKVNPPYDTFDFPEGSRQVISMLSFILGYDSDDFTDASILGFLSTLSPGQPPSIVFNFSKIIA